MPDADVIADVSETLRKVLDDALMDALGIPAVLEDLDASPTATPARATIFLYEIVEDSYSRNRARRVTQPSPSDPTVTISKPPMALLLRYLVAPWGGTPRTKQRIIGQVLQVLYDGAIVAGMPLQGTLANTDQALKITLAPRTLEELTRIWWAVQQPYHLSLPYEVRVVNLDVPASTQPRTRPATGSGQQVSGG